MTASGRMQADLGWSGDEQQDIALLAQRLQVRTWLVGGRDDELIEAVHRHLPALRRLLARVGCTVTVEPDLVRMHKAAGLRCGRIRQGASPEGMWLWLTAAVLESMPPKAKLGQVVAAARAAAAEVEIPVTQSRAELHALHAGLRMLCDRGVLEEVDGRIEALLEGQEDPPVLLRVHHTRLLHLLPRDVAVDEHGQWLADPADDAQGWLEQLPRPGDPGVRVCAMLADQAVVHACDLDPDERHWISVRLADDGAAVAEAFGLRLEHRMEGAAFVMPEEALCAGGLLGPFRFPHRQRNGAGTVRHAALLLIDCLTAEGERDGTMAPGPGWCGAPAAVVVDRLGEMAARHTGWAGEYRAQPARLADHVQGLLEQADLLRVTDGYEAWWWLSPAAARWTVVADQPVPPSPGSRLEETL
ncbi:hypothetical protein GCM10010254_74420 [Streptomyces chromofuscus]|nr:hypothetical protein GCM10010254_74420 [Streptomyces chromofuscus]